MIHVRRPVFVRLECGNPILSTNGPPFMATLRPDIVSYAVNNPPGIRKVSESDPLMKRRKIRDGIKTGVYVELRDESGGCPFIGQAVSGVKATESDLRLLHETWEGVCRYCARPLQRGAGARGSASSSRNCEASSTVAAALADQLVVVMKRL
jgi:hypothetical protein